MPRDLHVDTLPLDAAPGGAVATRLAAWLIRDARFLPGNRELLEAGRIIPE